MTLFLLLELTVLAVILSCEGVLGAWISTQVRKQELAWYFVLLSGNLSIFVWAYLSKWSKMDLAMASVFFDVVYNGVWFAALIYFGAKLSPVQMVGVSLMVVGLGLMGYGQEIK